MKHKIKSFLTTPFVCLILIISMFALPVSANAEAGTLGTETPELSCLFTNEDGDKVNGNVLTPGDYNVDIVLSGMKAVSIVELTATIDSNVITQKSIKSTYSGLKLGGQKVESSTISVFMISEDADSSAIDTNGTIMVSLSVKVASSCDFADVFTFSTDPNLCFVEASYLDGYDDAYVLDTTVETTYKTYPMTADASPYFHYDKYDVTGEVTIAAELEGNATTVAAEGITVTVDGTDISAVTGEDGSYTLKGLEEGTYTLTFSGPSTVDRTADLTVSESKAGKNSDQITVSTSGICVVDYNKDTKFNATDVALFSKSKTDLDGDGTFNQSDIDIFMVFFRNTVNYAQLNL